MEFVFLSKVQWKDTGIVKLEKSVTLFPFEISLLEQCLDGIVNRAGKMSIIIVLVRGDSGFELCRKSREPGF